MSLTTWKAVDLGDGGGRARCQAVTTSHDSRERHPIPTRTRTTGRGTRGTGIAASQPLGYRLPRVLGHLDILPALTLRLATKPSAPVAP